MNLRAVSYLLLAMLLIAFQDALFKQLIQEYAILQLLFVRMSIVVITMLSIYVVHRKTLTLKTAQWSLMAVRGTAAFFAFFLFYIALQRMGLAEAGTVLMSAPLFVTALSMPLLGEKVGVHRWSAVAIGFLAVVMMMRPGSALFNPLMILPLISAMVYSLIPIITRMIRDDISTFTITFHTTLAYWTLCAIGAVVVHWVPATPNSAVAYQTIAQPWLNLDLRSTLIITLCAALFMATISLITMAYRQAQASSIASFEYAYLVWAMIIGYVMFGDTPSLLTYAAALVIISCGFYIAWREHKAGDEIVTNPLVRS